MFSPLPTDFQAKNSCNSNCQFLQYTVTGACHRQTRFFGTRRGESLHEESDVSGASANIQVLNTHQSTFHFKTILTKSIFRSKPDKINSQDEELLPNGGHRPVSPQSIPTNGPRPSLPSTHLPKNVDRMCKVDQTVYETTRTALRCILQVNELLPTSILLFTILVRTSLVEISILCQF